MKRLLSIAMLIGVSWSVCQADETGTPKIVFDKMVYNFGSTAMVQQVAGTFVISNAGNAQLTLGKPATSCGCTIAALTVDKLAPGEKTDLGFTMNVSIPRGIIEKQITIPSNDPSNQASRLTIRVEIVPAFEYNPQALDVGHLRLGTTTNLTIQIKRTDGKPIGIKTVDANAAHIHPTIEKSEGGTNALTVRVEIVADGVARRFNNTVNIHGEDASRPLLIIPVSGQIVGDVVLTPQQLVWGIPDPENWPGSQGAASTTRRVIVSSSVPDQKLEITNLSSTVADLKVTLNPSADGKFEIVAVLDKVPKESIAGTVRFETNFKKQPVVEIPFTINVLRRN